MISKRLIIFYFLLIILLFILSFRAPIDPDLGWHLRVGEYIYQNGQVPTDAIFNWSYQDYPFIDFNWLANLIMWLIYDNFGLLALTFLFSTILTFFFIWICIKLRFNNTPISYNIIAFIITFPVWFMFYGVRVQIFSWIFYSILLYSFWINKKVRKFLPLLFLFWANVHGSFLFGIVMYLLLMIIEFVVESKNLESIKKSIIIFIFSLISTFITPYGLGIWKEVLSQQSISAPYNYIMEWHSPDFHSETGTFILILISLLLVVFYFSKPKKESIRYIIIFITLWLGLFSVRHLPFLLITITPLLSQFFSGFIGNVTIKIKPIFQYLSSLLVIAIIILIIPTFNSHIITSQSVENIGKTGQYPYKIVQYLKKHPALLKKRAINQYSLGGYLIWNFPEKKWFMDGRMAAWRIKGHKINELAVLLESKVSAADPVGMKYVKDNHVELVIYDKNSTIIKVLKEKNDWHLLSKDGDYNLMVKK